MDLIIIVKKKTDDRINSTSMIGTEILLNTLIDNEEENLICKNIKFYV